MKKTILAWLIFRESSVKISYSWKNTLTVPELQAKRCFKCFKCIQMICHKKRNHKIALASFKFTFSQKQTKPEVINFL